MSSGFFNTRLHEATFGLGQPVFDYEPVGLGPACGSGVWLTPPNKRGRLTTTPITPEHQDKEKLPDNANDEVHVKKEVSAGHHSPAETVIDSESEAEIVVAAVKPVETAQWAVKDWAKLKEQACEIGERNAMLHEDVESSVLRTPRKHRMIV